MFSILIANYNNGKFFKDCFDSILSQTYADWEVVIVDDCSSDDSVEVIRSIIRGDNRFRLFQNKINKGCGYTKRKCVEFAKGELCGFLDPDDMLEPDALEVMVTALENKRNIVLAHSKLRYYDTNMNFTGEYLTATSVNNSDPYFFNLNFAITAFSAFRREAYEKTEGINPFMLRAVDQDLYLKMYEVGDVFFVDRFLYKYRVHSGGIASDGLNSEKAHYWHWHAIHNTAERRGINVENIFIEKLVRKSLYDSIIQGKSYRLARFLSKVKYSITRIFSLS